MLYSLNPPEYLDLFYIALLRISNGVCLFLAIKFATLNWLAPISYLKFVLMAICSLVLLDEIPMQNQISLAVSLLLLNMVMSYQAKKNFYAP